MKKIILATKNNGKAKEFKEIFGSIGIEIVTLLDLEEDIPEIEETGKHLKKMPPLKPKR